jgi:Sodium/hydrogen exchanger family
MLFKLFAFLAETCIFLELGLSLFGLSGKFQWKFICWAILAALVGRAASIYPLAACYNLSLTRVVKVMASCGGSAGDVFDDEGGNNSSHGGSLTSDGSWARRRETPLKCLDKRISLNFMHMLTFAGLRGAVAYACARDFPNLYGNRDSFVTTTMAVVLFTIIIMGGATQTLLESLNIRTGVDEKEYMRHWHAQRKLKGLFHRFEHHYIYRLAIRQPSNSTGIFLDSLDRSFHPSGPGAIQLCATASMDNTSKRHRVLEDAAFAYRDMDDHYDDRTAPWIVHQSDDLAAYADTVERVRLPQPSSGDRHMDPHSQNPHLESPDELANREFDDDMKDKELNDTETDDAPVVRLRSHVVGDSDLV